MPTFPRGHAHQRTHTQNRRRLKNLETTPSPPTANDLSESITRDKLILQLISRDGNRCYICNQTLPPREYEIDHIIARTHGGPDRLTNYALACKPCNARKSDRIISIRISDRIPCLDLAALA